MRVLAAYVGVILIWSTTPLAIKWSSEGPGFLFGVTSRMLIGCACLASVYAVLRRPLLWTAKSRASYLAGAVQIFGSMIATYWSAQFIPSGWISVVFGLSPLMTAGLAALWLGERALRAGKLAAYALGMTGLAVMFGSARGFGESAELGIAGVLVAAFLQSFSAVWIKRIAANLAALDQVFGALLLATPAYLLAWWIGDGHWPDSLPPISIGSIVYLGVMASTVGFGLYFYVLRELSATQVSLITLLTPTLSLWVGHWANGEPVTAAIAFGTALILAAVFFHEFVGRVRFDVGRLRRHSAEQASLGLGELEQSLGSKSVEMTASAIEVVDLEFEYPGVRALDRISFTIPRGSITALVGPNGAGKTTLLRCIAALELPLAGAISVDGLDVLQAPRACHRRVGYLSDSFGLYDSLTVAQCLRYAARANGLPPAEAEAALQNVAARLGLADRLAQRAGDLSRGLRQRVAIGQAVIHRPSVVLLDEPAAGLDPEARHELSGLFRSLRADGMTLLVSSHILAELAEYSTDMLVLRAGRVVEQQRIAPVAGPVARYRVQLVHLTAPAELESRLTALHGVGDVSVQGNAAEFGFAGDPAACHRLLRELIEAGFPVCGFSEVRVDLQASYLASVSKPGAKR